MHVLHHGIREQVASLGTTCPQFAVFVRSCGHAWCKQGGHPVCGAMLCVCQGCCGLEPLLSGCRPVDASAACAGLQQSVFCACLLQPAWLAQFVWTKHLTARGLLAVSDDSLAGCWPLSSLGRAPAEPGGMWLQSGAMERAAQPSPS